MVVNERHVSLEITQPNNRAAETLLSTTQHESEKVPGHGIVCPSAYYLRSYGGLHIRKLCHRHMQYYCNAVCRILSGLGSG